MASIRYKALVLFSIAAICVSLLSLLSCHLLPSYARLDPVLRLPSEISGRRLKAGGDDSVGTRWAIPIAGSSGCGNYRHQWDDCLSSQSDANLVDYWNEFLNSPEGSSKKLDAQKELLDILTHRVHVDNSINLIGKLLFGSEKGIQVLSAVQKTGQPLVNDLACLKSMIRIFETHCGSLSDYARFHPLDGVLFIEASVSEMGYTKEGKHNLMLVSGYLLQCCKLKFGTLSIAYALISGSLAWELLSGHAWISGYLLVNSINLFRKCLRT